MEGSFEEEGERSPHKAFILKDLYSIYLKWVAKVNGPIECEGEVVLPSRDRVVAMERRKFDEWICSLLVAEIGSKVELWEMPKNWTSEDDMDFEQELLRRLSGGDSLPGLEL